MFSPLNRRTCELAPWPPPSAARERLEPPMAEPPSTSTGRRALPVAATTRTVRRLFVLLSTLPGPALPPAPAPARAAAPF